MAARKPARGRKKKVTGSRAKPASRKRRAAPKKAAGRKKTASRKKAVQRKKTVQRKKAVTKSRVTRKKATRTAGRKKPAGKTAAVRPSPIPSGIGLLVQHMDYTSHAMDEVRRFYTETLGFSDFTLLGEYLMVRTGQSSSVGFMPPMAGPPDQWQPPREPTIYLMVEDVDRVYRQLTARGVEFDQAPQDTLWGHRVAMLRDPEGRTVCVAHVIQE